MNAQTFLRTMVETLKWDDDEYVESEKMLSILRYSEIDFEKTTSFTRKTYQYYENIAIRVNVPMLKESRKSVPDFQKLVSQVYRETDDYDLGKVIMKPKAVESEDVKIVEHSVSFNQIREEIIQGIRIAKYSIWVAVAWFTDDVIYKELLEKKKKGLQIRVITSVNKNNNRLKDELICNFNALFVPRFGSYGYNLIHNKFCIIDFEFVMHGSYNWTYAAEYNEETWITSIDKELVSDFAMEFKRLYVDYGQEN